MCIEIIAFLLKMFASHYCVGFFHIFSMIIQTYVKTCFGFTYILFITKNALHEIYNVAAGTIDVVEYLIYIFALLAFKSNCFSSLLATKWPYIYQARTGFVMVVVSVFLYFWRYSFQFCYCLLKLWGFYLAYLLFLVDN